MNPDGSITRYDIGNIVFEDIIKENEITQKKYRFKPRSIGECKVEVYSDEGAIPHFHIFNLDHSFECCVRIYDANFFSHNKYRDKLNLNQCKELDNWLKQINHKVPMTATNWQIIASVWEISNPNCKFPNNKKVQVQPDYTTMCNFKDSI